MPRGRGLPAMSVPPGTTYGSWEVVREVDRHKTNRRFECRCQGCGATATKWLSNLAQGKTTCLTCRPWSTIHRGTLAAIAARRRRVAQVSDEGRMCHTCATWKTWDHFRLDPRRPEQRASNCVECGRWRRIRRHYGIGKREWVQLASPDGGCVLCGELNGLMIDHYHGCCGSEFGCVKCLRGLLCDFCNRVLGRIEQKPELAARFSDYLLRRPLLDLSARSA
jgi:Predicted ATP-dependent serine protease